MKVEIVMFRFAEQLYVGAVDSFSWISFSSINRKSET